MTGPRIGPPRLRRRGGPCVAKLETSAILATIALTLLAAPRPPGQGRGHRRRPPCKPRQHPTLDDLVALDGPATRPALPPIRTRLNPIGQGPGPSPLSRFPLPPSPLQRREDRLARQGLRPRDLDRDQPVLRPQGHQGQRLRRPELARRPTPR